ncbi:hypothetical protein FOQG_14009 [Fusarium oxysporum f. sp. raphani 54005]|uniref:Uncharacterized protein n=1 Tax=Fusarium oxysporum f. sp. raphani 54005 TaxID=1089458 RepID=X0BIC8_FUSOX|nr:hypothetical protein FOQG_14009 [Fusarium oxysporum f. sp. raphani 54005]
MAIPRYWEGQFGEDQEEFTSYTRLHVRSTERQKGGNKEEVYLILKLMEDASDDMEDSLPTYRRIVIVANQGKSGLAGEKVFILR